MSATEIFHVLSAALLVPVLGCLFVLLAWMLLVAGGLAAEFLSRVRGRRGRDEILAAAAASPSPSASILDPQRLARGRLDGILAWFLRRCAAVALDDSATRERLLDEIEIEASRKIASLTLVARVGPMLGLMGTLVPLGPALQALARGDLATLSGKLTIAFGTTIVGLLVGGGAHACANLRRGWYAQDLADIQFLYRRMQPSTVEGSRDP